MGSSKIIMEQGTIIWLLSETVGSTKPIIHNIDGPAVIHTDGTREWRNMGILHRIDGPAKEVATGEQQWWYEGQRHRLDGPAIVKANPSERSWWINGQHIISAHHFKFLSECSDEHLAMLILKYGEIS